MPFNVTQGNTAQFVIEPISSLGALVVPSSLTLTIAYNAGGTATTATPTMTLTNSFWVGSWDTTPADLGEATWTVTYNGLPGTAATGTLRIIE